MDDDDDKSTPWAPSQHKGMRCVCRSHDARRCMAYRYNLDLDEMDPDDVCECCCHDRDEFEDDLT